MFVSECKDTIVPASMCGSYRRICDVSLIVQDKCCATCFKKRRHNRHNRRQILNH